MERSVCKSAAQPRSLFCCLHPVETTDVRGSEPFAHARTTLPRETRQDVAAWRRLAMRERFLASG